MKGIMIFQIGIGTSIGVIMLLLATLIAVLGPQVLKCKEGLSEKDAEAIAYALTYFVIIIVGGLIFLIGYNLITDAYVVTVVVVALGAYIKENFLRKKEDLIVSD